MLEVHVEGVDLEVVGYFGVLYGDVIGYVFVEVVATEDVECFG